MTLIEKDSLYLLMLSRDGARRAISITYIKPSSCESKRAFDCNSPNSTHPSGVVLNKRGLKLHN